MDFELLKAIERIDASTWKNLNQLFSKEESISQELLLKGIKELIRNRFEKFMMKDEKKEIIKELIKDYFERVFGKDTVGKVEIYGPPEGPHEGIMIHFSKTIDRDKYFEVKSGLRKVLDEKNIELPVGHIIKSEA